MSLSKNSWYLWAHCKIYTITRDAWVVGKKKYGRIMLEQPIFDEMGEKIKWTHYGRLNNSPYILLLKCVYQKLNTSELPLYRSILLPNDLFLKKIAFQELWVYYGDGAHEITMEKNGFSKKAVPFLGARNFEPTKILDTPSQCFSPVFFARDKLVKNLTRDTWVQI